MTSFTPTLLTDKTRLQEIYDLRVLSWENSEQKEYVNKHYFPNGWFDKLDDDAYHFIIEDNCKIIASSRICIVNDINEIEENFSQFSLPNQRPLAFFSRLVVHPNYRGKNISKLMDEIRLNFIKTNNIYFSIAYSNVPQRIESLSNYGFMELGEMYHTYGGNLKVDIDTALIVMLRDIKI